jgi:PAS domain S-box-containing protein
VAVTDGHKALTAARAQRPDLVLTDVMMPNLDGFGLLKALRADARTAVTPIILLSARAGEEARIEGHAAGADDYLVKPFSARELIARISGTLALSRLRREIARREAELKAEKASVLESIQEAFIAVDSEWQITYVNAQAERIYERLRSDMVGRNLWEIYPELKATSFAPAYRRVMAERVTLRLEEYHRPLAGWFEVSIHPLPDGGIGVYFRDISQRKRTEAIVVGQKQALELEINGASIERVLTVLTRTVESQSGEGARAAIQLVDADGLRLRSGAAPSLPAAYVGALDGMGIGPMAASCGAAAYTRQAVAASDIQADPLWADYKELAREHGLLASWSTPLFSSQGRVLGTFSLYYSEPRSPAASDREVVDVMAHTASLVLERRVEMRERLLAENALKDADRRKDEFLATLAHELRNPLAPIRSGLQLLRMTQGVDPSTERVYGMMERQVNHLVRLVDDLLEISRITRGKIDLRPEDINVATVVRSAIDTSRPLIEAAEHELSVSIPDEPLLVRADPVRLSQVIANLLNNAAKYSPRRGHIWLTVGTQHDQVRIAVRDKGVGIPPEMLPRVFELFTQVDRTQKQSQGGLGIGLALVKSLVDMHHGRIEARSEGPDRGSEFIVYLPLRSAQKTGENRADRGPHASPTLPRLRIVVVDDSLDAADSLGMMLQHLGCDVHTANDGRSALLAIAQHQPEIVLLDIGMPGMDGYEVARRVRQQDARREIVLIALTGWGQAEDRVQSKLAGFDHHLVKPVELPVLQALLTSIVLPRRLPAPGGR